MNNCMLPENYWTAKPGTYQLALRPTKTQISSYQSLRCPHEQLLHPWLSKMRSLKILIKLRVCAGWSNFSLYAHVLRYIFWLCGSFISGTSEVTSTVFLSWLIRIFNFRHALIISNSIMIHNLRASSELFDHICLDNSLWPSISYEANMRQLRVELESVGKLMINYTRIKNVHKIVCCLIICIHCL